MENHEEGCFTFPPQQVDLDAMGCAAHVLEVGSYIHTQSFLPFSWSMIRWQRKVVFLSPSEITHMFFQKCFGIPRATSP